MTDSSDFCLIVHLRGGGRLATYCPEAMARDQMRRFQDGTWAREGVGGLWSIWTDETGPASTFALAEVVGVEIYRQRKSDDSAEQERSRQLREWTRMMREMLAAMKAGDDWKGDSE